MRLRWKCLSRFVVALAGKGSFDSLRTSRREVLTPLRMTAYLVLIDSPANTICASHFSARSPERVLRFDQRNFLSSCPSFQLLLSIDCFPHIVKAFVVDQTSAIVLGRESFDFTSLVLEHPAINAVGHPEV